MSLSKGQNKYFSADLPNSDQVASFLYDAAGTALTSTLVGGKQSLDVNMVNSISVLLDGIYDGVTNLAPDNVGLISHVRGATPDETDQTFRSTGGVASSDSVVAANVHGMDIMSFGMLFNGTTFDRIRSKNLGNVAVNDSASAVSSVAVSIAATATALVASALSGRREITIQNLGNKKIYIGQDNTVTVASGLMLQAGSSASFKWDSGVAPFAISESGSVDCRILQAA